MADIFDGYRLAQAWDERALDLAPRSAYPAQATADAATGLAADAIGLGAREQARTALTTAGIDKHVRSWERPSDHVPVYVDLDIEAA